MPEDAYRPLSLWHDTVPGPLEPRPPLGGDERVDVAIVGAGYTGLWTAYYLTQREPSLRVAIVEAEIAGFGASGRNGGWVVGELAGIDDRLSDPSQREGAIALQRAMFETVDEIGRVTAEESIDCHYAKGGNVTVATAPAHRDTLRRTLDGWHSLGFDESDIRWLDADASARRLATATNHGGLFFAHCASIHPARLVRGLAEVVEARGVTIYERSPARATEPGAVRLDSGRLSAPIVVRATEGYTHTLSGEARTLMPLHSMMIATEPLPERTWAEIGLADRETFADPRRTVIYGQRTADGRIAFGARGRYYLRSGVRDRFPADDAIFRGVQATLESLLPILKQHRITHRWGGVLGVPRDWQPRVGLDRTTGLAWGGGYVGEGVAASNLAGRTLADLILEHDTERVRLPLVGPQFGKWEPEPLRWIAARAVMRAGEALDAAERERRAVPRVADALFSAVVRK